MSNFRMSGATLGGQGIKRQPGLNCLTPPLIHIDQCVPVRGGAGRRIRKLLLVVESSNPQAKTLGASLACIEKS
jgi:hypothetical protein